MTDVGHEMDDGAHEVAGVSCRFAGDGAYSGSLELRRFGSRSATKPSRGM